MQTLEDRHDMGKATKRNPSNTRIQGSASLVELIHGLLRSRYHVVLVAERMSRKTKPNGKTNATHGCRFQNFDMESEKVEYLFVGADPRNCAR